MRRQRDGGQDQVRRDLGGDHERAGRVAGQADLVAALSERTRRRSVESTGHRRRPKSAPASRARPRGIIAFLGRARPGRRASVGAPEPLATRRPCGPSASCPARAPRAWGGSSASFRDARARGGPSLGRAPGAARRSRPGRKPPGAARRTEVAGRTAGTAPGASGAPPKPPGPPGPRGRAAWPARAAGGHQSRRRPGRRPPGAATAIAAAGPRPRRLGLRLLDDDRTPLQDAARRASRSKPWRRRRSSVSTKANPRGRPVSRSSATRTLRSSIPSPVNASRSSCSVTLYERLPMKSRVPIVFSCCLLVLSACVGAWTVRVA